MNGSTVKHCNYDGLIAAMGFDDERFEHVPAVLIENYSLALALLEESLGWCAASPELPIQCENFWSFGTCLGGTYTPPLGPNRRTAPQLLDEPFGLGKNSYKLSLELEGNSLTAVFRLPPNNPHCLDTGRLYGTGFNGLSLRLDVVNFNGDVIGSGLTARAAYRSAVCSV